MRTWFVSSQRAKGGVVGGEWGCARQSEPTAAIAASPSGDSQPRHLRHVAISGTHAGKHAQACVSGYGNAGVGGGQAGHAQGIGAMRAKARVISCIMGSPVRIRHQ